MKNNRYHLCDRCTHERECWHRRKKGIRLARLKRFPFIWVFIARSRPWTKKDVKWCSHYDQ